MREKQDVANARAICKKHDQSVDADTFSCGGRQPVLERADVVGVVVHRFFVARGFRFRLLLEARRLVLGVVELGETIGDLASGDVELEAVGDLRMRVVASRERRYLGGVVDDEGRLGERVFDGFEGLSLSTARLDFDPLSRPRSRAQGQRLGVASPAYAGACFRRACSIVRRSNGFPARSSARRSAALSFRAPPSPAHAASPR